MATALRPASVSAMSSPSWQGRHVGIVLGALAAGSRERVIAGLADRLADAGAKVDLLIPGESDIVTRDRAPAVHSIDMSDWLTARLPNIVRLALAPPKIAAYLRNARPDVVLSLSIPPNLATLAAKRLAGTATRVVIRQSNVLRVDGSPIYGHVDRRWRDRLIGKLYPDADAVIAVSEGVADNLGRAIDIDTNRIHAIANGIPLERIERLASVSPPHPWLTDPTVPAIVAVGRLVRKKDYPTLLSALSMLRQKRPARLIILGEGPKRRDIERLRSTFGLDQAVDLPGRVDNPFAYLARASLYVLSSTYEGMPSALIEALACGCPAVSTDCPSGPSEILDSGRIGHLVPVGNCQALADAMATTLENPPPRHRQRSRGAAFSAERTIDGYLEVLDGVCSGASR